LRTPDPDLHRRRSAEIVAAATRAFLAKGFHATSMQDVAREAGVSMGLLYRYFADKAALIAAAAAVDRAAVISEIEGLAAAARPAKAVRRLALQLIETSREAGYVELIAEVAAEACRNPAVASVLREDGAMVRQALVSALEAQKAAGRIRRNADLEAFAVLFLTSIDAIALHAQLEPSLDVEALLDAFAPAIDTLLA
jgi:AcrR family transcriptional regulator